MMESFSNSGSSSLWGCYCKPLGVGNRSSPAPGRRPVSRVAKNVAQAATQGASRRSGGMKGQRGLVHGPRLRAIAQPLPGEIPEPHQELGIVATGDGCLAKERS